MKKKKHGTRDINALGKSVADFATDENLEDKPKEKTGKNPAAVELGRLGGKKGGKARAKKLTPQQRSDIARIAAKARWKKTED